MSDPLSPILSFTPETIATATLVVETGGQAFTDITREAMRFIKQTGAKDGALFMFMRHTSASLVIQENADPDVRTDLVSALDRLAPADAHWVHDVEGPDDMPAHVKTMLTGVSLHVPVIAGALALGVWQGIYIAEHRARPHRREIVLQFIGSKGESWLCVLTNPDRSEPMAGREHDPEVVLCYWRWRRVDPRDRGSGGDEAGARIGTLDHRGRPSAVSRRFARGRLRSVRGGRDCRGRVLRGCGEAA